MITMKKEIMQTNSGYYLQVRNPKTNKRYQKIVNNYFSFKEESTIHTIYKKPCTKNCEAFIELKYQCSLDNGYDLRVGNPTCHSWCLGYRLNGVSEEDGTVSNYLIYHTRDNIYCILLND